MSDIVTEKSKLKAWGLLEREGQVSPAQLELFQRYAIFLTDRNEEMNLTAITNPLSVVRYHFLDSLALAKFVDMASIKTIADVGTGAGFPAIPLKIMYPHLKLVLIEVNNKKRQFLADLIKLLELDGVELCGYDWRTVLRTTEYEIDLFVTRAALPDEELCRVFKPGCRYKNVPLAYWASKDWQAHLKSAEFVRRVEEYKIALKHRKIVFFGLPE